MSQAARWFPVRLARLQPALRGRFQGPSLLAVGFRPWGLEAGAVELRWVRREPCGGLRLNHGNGPRWPHTPILWPSCRVLRPTETFGSNGESLWADSASLGKGTENTGAWHINKGALRSVGTSHSKRQAGHWFRSHLGFCTAQGDGCEQQRVDVQEGDKGKALGSAKRPLAWAESCGVEGQTQQLATARVRNQMVPPPRPRLLSPGLQ